MLGLIVLLTSLLLCLCDKKGVGSSEQTLVDNIISKHFQRLQQDEELQGTAIYRSDPSGIPSLLVNLKN
jgi:hypothetical protein